MQPLINTNDPPQPCDQAAAATGRFAACVSDFSSSLISALFHLLLLLVFALVLLPHRGDSDRELVMSFADGATVETIDEFEFEVALPDAESAPSATAAASSSDAKWFTEPELASLDEGIGLQADPLQGFVNKSLTDTLGVVGESDEGKYKTSFFGVSSQGNRFVYILDVSTSMRAATRYGRSRLEVAGRELMRSVDALADNQQFEVILFCHSTVFFASGTSKPRLVRATSQNKARLESWLSRVTTGAGTDPRQGVHIALKLKPDAIFLLSDGEFNGQRQNLQRVPGNAPIERIIAASANEETPIHTIAFEEVASQKRLRGIAEATGGKHRFVGG